LVKLTLKTPSNPSENAKNCKNGDSKNISVNMIFGYYGFKNYCII
tara:strand:- start:1092 stop:1226 length:135 start_codon:yes stop_codon:yes gene_type:complete